MENQITFLGTGTSQGIPVIGCDCEVCVSSDKRDKRLRTSALITINGINLLIDIGPDFRQQMLRENIKEVNAILITHDHNDHIIGLDDVRPFNFITRKDMPVYASKPVIECIADRFAYIFSKNPYPGAPKIELISFSKDENINFKGIEIIPIEASHGMMPVFGFRIGDLTYLTDVKTISNSELEKILSTKILIINALHKRRHRSHLTLNEALDLIKKINPEKAFLTHISHTMGLTGEVEKELPENVSFAFDGLKVLF